MFHDVIDSVLAIERWQFGSQQQPDTNMGQVMLTVCLILVQNWLCPVSEMTYTVSSGTLNSTVPYHTGCVLGG